MFGNRHHTPMTSLTHDSVRSSALHASTLAVFLLGMIGEGFSPCPHHTGLDPSGPALAGVFTEAIPGGMFHADATPTDSQSEHDEDPCSCLNACEPESEDSLSPGQSHIRPVPFTVLNVVERLDTSLLDARPNAYLVPLPQPPPA